MPNRPRQHTLEDESRKAFKLHLPEEWVFRDYTPDYGIDGEVEIFDQKGQATGLTFYVQLKATDSPNIKAALSVSILVNTLCYYRSLGVPVLIVSYHSRSKKLFVRWAHTFDPYYGRKGAKRVSFKLTNEAEWIGSTAQRIKGDLEAIRHIRSPHVPLPIHFYLQITQTEVHGHPAVILASAIRKVASKAAGIIQVNSGSPEKACPRIEINNDNMIIDLAGVYTTTIHTRKGYPPDLALTQFPNDVLVAVGVVLGIAGHNSVGARVLTTCVKDSSLVHNLDFLPNIVTCFAKGHRITEALEVSEQLLQMPENSEVANLLFLLPPLLKSKSLSASERQYYVSFLKRRIDHAATKGDKGILGTCHYNLGNFLRGSDDRLALFHYEQAARNDPSYRKRGYYWRELGGLMFHAKEYDKAVKFYSKALKLGIRGDTRALLADSMMFAGRYSRACQEFTKHLSMTANANSEWHLKAYGLRGIRSMMGITSQRRDIKQGLKLATRNNGMSSDKWEQNLKKALMHDALCGLAWFNLGVLKYEHKQLDDAFIAFLMTSLVQPGDVEAWSNCVLLGSGLEKHIKLVPMVVQTAYRLNGETFLGMLSEIAEKQPLESKEGAIYLINLINECVGDIRESKEPVELRMIRGDGNYTSVHLCS